VALGPGVACRLPFNIDAGPDEAGAHPSTTAWTKARAGAMVFKAARRPRTRKVQRPHAGVDQRRGDLRRRGFVRPHAEVTAHGARRHPAGSGWWLGGAGPQPTTSRRTGVGNSSPVGREPFGRAP